MMMQPVYQYMPSQQVGQMPRGGTGGIHNKMRQTKQQAFSNRGPTPIEQRVLLRDGRSVNQMNHLSNAPRSIESRVKRPAQL